MSTTTYAGAIAPMVTYSPTASNPWNEDKVKHVYRRLGFGASNATINVALYKNPNQLIHELIDEAIHMPNPSVPEWSHWANKDFDDYHSDNSLCKYKIRRDTIETTLKKGLKGRLSLFWMNHFVTDVDTYEHAPYMFQYWNLLQTHAIGNFKTFVEEIGLSPAMLIFLNGFENTKNKPNENYARELLELFTLGVNNGYTQYDITEIAKALTGYTRRDTAGGEIMFDPNTFDNSHKTIFGQTNNWNYKNVITILFQKKGRLISKYIAEKLYKYFVSPDVDKQVVQAMADVFFDNDYEIAPMLQLLFSSEHFFEEKVQGTIIKSPYDLICGFLNEISLDYKIDQNDRSIGDMYNFIHHITTQLGQRIFKPTDVSGWQRNESWINGSTIGFRWQTLDTSVLKIREFRQGQLVDFTKNLTNNSSDPKYISRTLVDYFISKPLTTESDYDIAETVLKWQVPANYYEQGKWSLDWNNAELQILYLLRHLFTIPEFQLK